MLSSWQKFLFSKFSSWKSKSSSCLKIIWQQWVKGKYWNECNSWFGSWMRPLLYLSPFSIICRIMSLTPIWYFKLLLWFPRLKFEGWVKQLYFVDITDLLALYLSGTYCHTTGTRPPSCFTPRQPTIHPIIT